MEISTIAYINIWEFLLALGDVYLCSQVLIFVFIPCGVFWIQWANDEPIAFQQFQAAELHPFGLSYAKRFIIN